MTWSSRKITRDLFSHWWRVISRGLGRRRRRKGSPPRLQMSLHPWIWSRERAEVSSSFCMVCLEWAKHQLQRQSQSTPAALSTQSLAEISDRLPKKWSRTSSAISSWHINGVVSFCLMRLTSSSLKDLRMETWLETPSCQVSQLLSSFFTL